jgi:hypothetical protein
VVFRRPHRLKKKKKKKNKKKKKKRPERHAGNRKVNISIKN